MTEISKECHSTFDLISIVLLLLLICIPFTATYAEEKVKEDEQAGLEVVKAMLSAGGSLVDIRYRISGSKGITHPIDAYVIDESTGEPFYVLAVKKIGPLGTKRTHFEGVKDSSDAVPLSFLIIMNRDDKIKAGSKLTVVIGKLRQEHVVVEE